jgi:hypothetical protein
MFRLLTVVITFGFAFGLNAAIGQTLDTDPQKTSGEYKMAKDVCKSPGQAGGDQCLKNAKATDENSRLRCTKLTDQAKRECVLEAFVEQHDRMIGGGRIENSEVAPPSGSQPR